MPLGHERSKARGPRPAHPRGPPKTRQHQSPEVQCRTVAQRSPGASRQECSPYPDSSIEGAPNRVDSRSIGAQTARPDPPGGWMHLKAQDRPAPHSLRRSGNSLPWTSPMAERSGLQVHRFGSHLQWSAPQSTRHPAPAIPNPTASRTPYPRSRSPTRGSVIRNATTDPIARTLTPASTDVTGYPTPA
jgi:hypothetical protein